MKMVKMVTSWLVYIYFVTGKENKRQKEKEKEKRENGKEKGKDIPELSSK